MIPYKSAVANPFIGQYHKVTDVRAADFADLGCEASSASRTPDGHKSRQEMEKGSYIMKTRKFLVRAWDFYW